MSFMQRYVTTAPNGGQSIHLLKVGVHAAVLVFALIMLMAYWPLKSVPTGTRGVVTVFGKITSVQNEGMTILLPWEKLAIFNIRAAKADIENADGSTSDTQPVKVSLTVRYAIDPQQVAHVYEQYSHDGDLSNYIETATEEVFKAVTAKYTATDLIAKRATVSADINTALKIKVAPYGAIIKNIDMRNFSLAPGYMKAIEEKVTQEQLKLAADNRVLTVRAEQESNVAVAEANAKIVKTKADGDAYAVEAAAKASANALTIQNKALAQNRDVLELRRIEVQMEIAKNWKGDVPTTVMDMGGGGSNKPNFLFQIPGMNTPAQ